MTRLGALLVGLLLTMSCSSGEGHNDADVAFATDMIGHHAQAIQMANFTIGREGLDPEVAGLAEDVRVSQTKEIDTLTGWLKDWEEPVPETGFATGDGHTHEDDGHGGMSDMEGEGMPGMMTAEEMDDLAGAPDADFERLWLEMMIEHHEGAVEMAQQVVEDGESAEVADLADRIAGAQEAEIEEMRAWLDEA